MAAASRPTTMSGLGCRRSASGPPNWAAPAVGRRPRVVAPWSKRSCPPRPQCRWPRTEEHDVAPIRVLICDDHPDFRQGLRALLETASDVDVVGEAADGDAALRAAVALQPDIILMDLNMPGINGIEATRRIVNSSPHIGVVVLSMV